MWLFSLIFICTIICCIFLRCLIRSNISSKAWKKYKSEKFFSKWFMLSFRKNSPHKVFFILNLLYSLAAVVIYILGIVSLLCKFKTMEGIVFFFQSTIFMFGFDTTMILWIFQSDNKILNPSIRARDIVVITITTIITIFVVVAMIYGLIIDFLRK